MKRAQIVRAPTILSVLLTASVAASPGFGQSFGSVTLRAGEARQISIGPAYRNIRICNDMTSNGTVVAAIRAGWSRTLTPGECLEDGGNAFSLQNQSGASATIRYSSKSDNMRLR